MAMKSPIYTQKNPIYTQKSPTYTQKSPTYTHNSHPHETHWKTTLQKYGAQNRPKAGISTIQKWVCSLYLNTFTYLAYTRCGVHKLTNFAGRLCCLASDSLSRKLSRTLPSKTNRVFCFWTTKPGKLYQTVLHLSRTLSSETNRIVFFWNYKIWDTQCLIHKWRRIYRSLFP